MSGFDAGVWANAEAPTGDFENNDPPDPGVYDVVVQDAKAFSSKAGNDIVVIEWNIMTGPQTGYSWGDVYGFKSPEAVGFTKAACASIGVDVQGVDDLEALDVSLKQRVGEYYTVEVKQNGEFRNTYVQGKTSGGQLPVSDVPSDGFEPVTASNDQSVPF